MITEDDYGTMVDFDVALTHNWAMLGFPKAFHTLQAQQHIMWTLKRIMDAIIDEDAGSGSKKWQDLVRSGFHGSGATSLGPYLNQAFVPPMAFAPQEMLKKANARLEIVLDEVWLMQTDPAYMQQVLKSMKADVSNVCSEVGIDDRLSLVAADLVMELVNRATAWQTIVELCKELCRLFEKMPEACRPGMILPLQPGFAINSLQDTLHSTLKMQILLLEKLLPRMRPVKDNFRITGSMSAGFGVRQKGNLDPAIGTDQLHYHLAHIKNAVLSCPMQGRAIVFEVIQKQAGKEMDKRVQDHLSDMMAVDEMFTSVLWSQRGRWRGPKAFLNMDRYVHPAAKFARSSSLISPDTSILLFDRKGIRHIAELVRDFAATPWPNGRKDLTWLAKADECREKCARLWHAIRAETGVSQRKVGQDAPLWMPSQEVLSQLDAAARADESKAMAQEFVDMMQADQKLLTDKPSVSTSQMDRFAASVMFDSEPRFLARLTEERRECEIEAARQAEKAEKAAEQPHPVCNAGEYDQGGNAVVYRKQTKAKALRLAAALDRDDIDDSVSQLAISNDDESDEPAKYRGPIPVAKDSLATFGKLFPANGRMARGEMRWNVFLQAMGDAGFTITEGSGSAVSFANEEGCISFHRPHPEPVIAPVLLPNMAKRLEKWFGWSSERFMLRG